VDDYKISYRLSDELIVWISPVLTADGGHRHEDHSGDKLFRDNFRIAVGNSATDAGPVTATSAVCDAQLKHLPTTCTKQLLTSMAPGYRAMHHPVPTLPHWYRQAGPVSLTSALISLM